MTRRCWLVSAILILATSCFGGPVDQAAVCAQYVRCIEAIDQRAGQTTNLVRYEQAGACWNNSEIAELCTTSCERALARIAELEPSAPMECQP